MNQFKDQTETKLIAQVAKGNTLAFKQIFDAYRPQVFGVALKMLRSNELAEEVVQEVFIKIWEKRETLTDVINFKGYLFKTARNRVFDEFKRISKEALDELPADEGIVKACNDTDHRLRDGQLDALLETTLNKLPEQQRYIFRLSREQGLTYREIADIVGLSPLTVKTHMKHTLAFLRNNLSSHLELYTLLICCGLLIA